MSCFDVLYHRHYHAINLFVTARVPSGNVDDLIQTVWVKVWTKFPEDFHSNNVLAWIFSTARNAISDFYRTQEVAEPLTDQLNVETVGPVESLLHSERQQILEHCIKRLKRKDRELIHSVFLGAAIKSIATTFNISTNATYKSLDRIKARLKRCVEGSIA